MTQPPKRFSPASIVSELEKRNLGTKATRANILETLYDRDYVRERSIEATPLGTSLITAMEKYSPIIIDEALTRHFEKEMEAIVESKKAQTEKQEKIINEAKNTITNIIKQLSENENKLGKELIGAQDEIIQQQREENTLNQCPNCKKGNLRILYNKKFKRYFVGCSNYPECKTTFSLPPGMIKNPHKVCEHCSFPKLLRIQKGKRPWEFCFNVNCPSRKEREE
jgi:DNA topoisomerase-1